MADVLVNLRDAEAVISFPQNGAIEKFLNYASSPSAAKLTDVSIVAPREARTFRCHRMVVAAQSQFLAELMRGRGDNDDEVTVIVPDVDGSVVEAAYHYMYRGEVCSDAGVAASAAELFRFGPRREHPSTEIGPPLVAKRVRKKNRRFFEDGDDYASEIPGMASVGAEEAPKGKRAKQTKTKSKAKVKEELECCDTKFENPAVLASHKENVHMEKLGKDRYMICCNKKIFGSLKKHLEKDHSLNPEEEKAECCDDTFESYELLTEHLTIRHGLRVNQFKRVTCCSKSLTDVEEFERHKEEDAGHIECNVCPFLTKDDSAHKLHMLEKHEDEASVRSGKGSPKYDCVAPECDKSFRLLASLKSHIYRMGRNHNPAEKKYSCDDCGSLFQSIVAKRKHHRSEHQKKDAHTCKTCSGEFVDKHRLDAHVKSVHLKVKDIQCTSCGKLFATNERMKIHEKFVHMVEAEKVPCNICLKSFQNRERMIDHRRSVHRDRKFQCDECGSTFKNSSTLKSHNVSIHLAHDKKPLKCSICGKGFLHESRRKAHEAIHSEESPFSCRFCGRPNKCKNNNLKHERRCKKAAGAQVTGAMGVPVSEAQRIVVQDPSLSQEAAPAANDGGMTKI